MVDDCGALALGEPVPYAALETTGLPFLRRDHLDGRLTAKSPEETAMEFRILGLLEVADGPRSIELRGSKLRTLLAVLLLHVNKVVSADALVEALWGDLAPDSAANTLQGYVSQLRKALGAGTILTRSPGYVMNVPAETIDAVRFERMLKEGQDALARDDPAPAARIFGDALGLWRGQALADFAFDSFAQVDIARLEELRLMATEHLAEADLALGRHDELVGRLRTLVENHPLRERLWAQLVLALYRSDRQAEALRTLAEVRRRLGEELGIEPVVGLQRLEEDVLLQRPHLDWRPPAAAAVEVPSNLPARRSSFVGRETEVDELDKLLGSRHLLTVVGPGGVGKTRLALEVGGHVRSRFPDGVWVVELASVTEPSLVPGAVAQALEVREQLGALPLEALARSLASRRLLLVLDNCEHLVGAAAGLADAILDAAPSLTILVTSREPLRVSGETIYALSPLPLPARDDLPPEALSSIDAVRLFCDRAEAQGLFSLTSENASAVAALCRRLDGIPLAIELAAARVRALTPSQILARLDDRFDLLSSGERTALPRHQTLRAAVDWSHDLLGPTERALFRRLAVFAGSFSLEAATSVCDDSAAPDQGHTVELLASLVDHSLVVSVEVKGERRFRLLETLRAYAAERLAEAGETEEVHQRLLAWAVAFAESFSDVLDPRRITYKGAVEQLDAENDNLRYVLGWALSADPHGALRLVAAVGRYWSIRGFVTERARWAEVALAAGPDVPVRTRTAVLHWAGVLANFAGEMGKARYLLEEALKGFREVGDRQGEAHTLSSLAWIANEYLADHDTAETLLRQSMAIYAQDDDDHLYCEKLGRLAVNTLRRGDAAEARRLMDGATEYNLRHADDPCPDVLETGGQCAFLVGRCDEATDLLERALRHVRDVGMTAKVATLLRELGEVALAGGDHAEAGRRFREQLATAQELGNTRETEYALWGLARVAVRLGDAVYARSALTQAMRLVRESGRAIDPDDLEAVAEMLTAEGRFEDAATVLGAQEACRQHRHQPIPVVHGPGHDRLVSQVAAGLESDAFAKAWRHGQGLSVDEAADLAFRAPASDPTSGSRRSHHT